MARLPFKFQATSPSPAEEPSPFTDSRDDGLKQSQASAKATDQPGRGSESTSGAGGTSGGTSGGGGGAGAMTVTQLSSLIKDVLAEHTPATVRVVGEVSNCSLRTHCFFSLKDQAAAVRCVCFATNLRRLRFRMADGLKVVVTGRLDYFAGQGNLQLYVDRIEPVGQGELELRLRQLMEELRGLGYFALERKKPLPLLPCHIAVVTSASGAALQDVINTASRRWPGCRLHLVDVRVQGPEAAPQVARAIEALSRHGPRLGIEGIILTRGGGSIEDLWAFNERVVADAVYRCRLPVVAAIGHEVDTTIAELVADIRAATPTQAAMMLIPDARALGQQIEQMSQRLTMMTQRHLAQSRQHVEAIARLPMFRRPQGALLPLRQRVETLNQRLTTALPGLMRQSRQALERVSSELNAAMPGHLSRATHQLDLLAPRLQSGAPRQVAAMRQRLDALQRQLAAVNPHNVLQRGYSFTLGPDGHVLKRSVDATPGQRITTVLAEGRLRSTVDADDAALSTQPSSDSCPVKAVTESTPRPAPHQRRPRRGVKRNAPSLFD